MENIRLKDIIEKADRGELIIPDFQRGFKWKPEDVRKLLESIALDYPIGAILLWETLNKELGFRTLDSVSVSEDEEIITEELDDDIKSKKYNYILDGQQRCTSIFKIFPRELKKSKAENDRVNKNIFRFYFDLNKLRYPIISNENDLEKYKKEGCNFNEDDIMESCQLITFESIRKDIKRLNKNLNPTNPDNQLIEETFRKLNLLPLTIDFLDGSDKILDKIIDNSKEISREIFPNHKEDIREIYSQWKDNFKKNIQTKITQKTVPAIKLEGQNYNALSRIFETINSTGQSLTTFDLLVARMSLWKESSSTTIGLRDVITERIDHNNLEKFDDPSNYGGTCCQQLPRVFGLKVDINGKEKSLKKADILSISATDLRKVAKKTCDAVNDSLSFLQGTLGVFNEKYLPFKDAITLAACIENFQNTKETSLFEAFYWQVVFTEDLEKDSNSTTKRLYSEWRTYQNQPSSSDIILDKISKNFPTFDELYEVQNKGSILYRAVLSFIFSRSTTDWKGNTVKDSKSLDDHHIFPKRSISKNLNIIGKEIDSVLNRVLIGEESNKATAYNHPDVYLIDFNLLDDFAIPSSFKTNPIPNDLDTFKLRLEERYNLIKKMVIDRVEICLLNATS